MYKSKQQLTKEWFGEYLKAKLIEKFPEGKEYFEGLPADLDYFESDWIVSNSFYVYVTGDEEPSWDTVDEGRREVWYGWNERKMCWLEETGFHTQITTYALEDGILESVEYEEIWCGG